MVNIAREGERVSVAVDPVVDVDVHIHERDADLAPYFELPWRRALEAEPVPQSQRNASGERLLDVPGDAPQTIYDPILGDFPEEPHRVTSADVLREDLDRRGIGATIITTGRLLRAGASNDIPYAAALARSYNRYLAERWLDPARGIHGAIMAANQAPDDAAREIARYAAADGFVAVYLAMAGTYPLWGDRSYDPIYAAAQEAGLPVALHGATTVHTVFPYQLHHMPTALAKQALSQPFGALANLTHMATTGVFDRFPRLRVVFHEVGVTWLSLLLGRLDHYWPYLREEAPFLAPRPSERLRGRVFVTTHAFASADAATLRAAMQSIGVEQVMFGSDWPHFDAAAPADLRHLDLPEGDERRILGDTAREVLPATPPAVIPVRIADRRTLLAPASDHAAPDSAAASARKV